MTTAVGMGEPMGKRRGEERRQNVLGGENNQAVASKSLLCPAHLCRGLWGPWAQARQESCGKEREHRPCLYLSVGFPTSAGKQAGPVWIYGRWEKIRPVRQALVSTQRVSHKASRPLSKRGASSLCHSLQRAEL
jgi:hypothetical protein